MPGLFGLVNINLFLKINLFYFFMYKTKKIRSVKADF